MYFYIPAHFKPGGNFLITVGSVPFEPPIPKDSAPFPLCFSHMIRVDTLCEGGRCSVGNGGQAELNQDFIMIPPTLCGTGWMIDLMRPLQTCQSHTRASSLHLEGFTL